MKIETVSFNRKMADLSGMEKILNEKLQGKSFEKIVLHESGNNVVAVLYAGAGNLGQQARVFGPSDLSKLVEDINAVDGEVTGKSIAVLSLTDTNRFVGTVLYRPVVAEEVASGGEDKRQDAGANGSPGRGKQRASKSKNPGVNG